MIGIEFSTEDAARTPIAATFGPFAEIVLGLGSVQMTRQDRLPAPVAHQQRPGSPISLAR
jgi:hypothetical protein